MTVPSLLTLWQNLVVGYQHPPENRARLPSIFSVCLSLFKGSTLFWSKQESPAIADKPARRESMPKIAPIRRAYNVVADNTGLSSFV